MSQLFNLFIVEKKKRIVRDGEKWGLSQKASHFTKIIKLIVFYEGFETYGILRKFLNS